MNFILPVDFFWTMIAAGSSVRAGGPRELVSYEFSRFQQLADQPLLSAGLVAIVLALLISTIGGYLRESRSLPRFAGSLLCLLRLLAIGGAILFFLNLQKRTDRQVTTQSQVAILVDSSQSMSVRDVSQLATGQSITRSEAVTNSLLETPWIDALRQKHNITLMGFDRQSHRLAQWDRLDLGSARDAGLTKGSSPPPPDPANTASPGQAPDPLATISTTSWTEALMPLGAETRLGDALQRVLGQPNSGPLAGVIVISDGGQNSGLDPLAVCEASSQETRRRIPLYTVGVGSTQPRRNMRVQELIAPSRLYPGDKTTIRGLIQADGFAGRSVEAELYARELTEKNATSDVSPLSHGAGGTGPAGLGSAENRPDSPAGRLMARGERVGRERITFATDAEVLPVEFDIEPAAKGRLQLTLRLAVPTDDQVLGDNLRQAEVEVVDAQLRVLLLASGATREYRFLRNQLRRDPHTQVDVCLQMAPPGLSQDAHRILAAFPSTKEDLYRYDSIVAFDPDWTLLDAQQVELLEKWVGEQAGGLVVIAGPIHTAHWTQSPELGKIRALYPVQFQRRLTLLDDGQYGSQTAWPIAFTRAGREAPFLWLGDTSESSHAIWSRFSGVYGCYAVKGPKPGARVLGYYSDPDAGISTEPPVYLAEQFYGAGRVFYMGSGEMWRLRRLDPGYFEVFYTQLIRHVSQGRLLRGSSRGSLLVERDRFTVGDTVVVRAQLTSIRRDPLLAANVTCHTVSPSGAGRNLKMTPIPGRAGSFIGQFTVLEQGTYRIELPIPDAGVAADSTDSLEASQLVRRIEVVLPNLEFEQTRRNERLLAALATRTGGRYYASLTAAIDGTSDLQPVARMIESRAEVKTIRGAADTGFTERLNRILLAILCGSLCLEWFLRRLLKLA